MADEEALPDPELTRLLAAARAGDAAALERIWPFLQDELHRRAHRYLLEQRPDHTLQTTALVHEAFLRIFGGGGGAVRDRGHFWGLAAQAMRSILVDYARTRSRDKRRPPGERVSLEIEEPADEKGKALDALDLLALDEALTALERFDAAMARLVELYYFAGLNVPEIARVTGRAERTIERELGVARRWLRRFLG